MGASERESREYTPVVAVVRTRRSDDRGKRKARPFPERRPWATRRYAYYGDGSSERYNVVPNRSKCVCDGRRIETRFLLKARVAPDKSTCSASLHVDTYSTYVVLRERRFGRTGYALAMARRSAETHGRLDGDATLLRKLNGVLDAQLATLRFPIIGGRKIKKRDTRAPSNNVGGRLIRAFVIRNAFPH